MIASPCLAALASVSSLASFAAPLRDERAIPSMASKPPDERWISIGFYDIDTRFESSDIAGDGDEAFSYGAGAWWWGDEFGSAAEAQILYSRHEATVSGNTGELQTWNLMVGARLGWRGIDDHFIPYARAGALWRNDNGDEFTAINDDGLGVYGGLGIEVRLGSHFALSPEILWTWADVSDDSTQAAAGLALVVRF